MMNGSKSDNLSSEHPGLVKWMQDTLASTHVDMQAIMLYGSESTMDAKEKEGQNAMVGLSEAEKNRLSIAIDTQYANLQSQIKNLPANEQTYYNSYVNREMIAEHVANTVSSAVLSDGTGLGVGVSARLDEVLK